MGEEYRSFSSSLCSFLHSHVVSSLLGPNILLSTLFSNTLSLRSSLNVSDQVSHPYNTTGIIIAFKGTINLNPPCRGQLLEFKLAASLRAQDIATVYLRTLNVYVTTPFFRLYTVEPSADQFIISWKWTGCAPVHILSSGFRLATDIKQRGTWSMNMFTWPGLEPVTSRIRSWVWPTVPRRTVKRCLEGEITVPHCEHDFCRISEMRKLAFMTLMLSYGRLTYWGTAW